jgi:diacylglycerol kinase family enzyme
MADSAISSGAINNDVMNTGAGAAAVRKHLFIINPISFRTQADIDSFISMVDRCFKETVKAEYRIRVSKFPRNAIGMVRQYITQEEPGTIVRVYAVGGDGILFDCLNGIVGLPNAELATVPYGHTNDFVRAFGEDLDELFRDIPLQAVSPVIPTDILHCGNNYALNLCTVGLESAAIFRAVELQQKLKALPSFIRDSFRIYRLIYYLGGAIAMFDQKVLRQEYIISIDGEDLSGSYASLNIANGPCYGGDKSAVVTAVPDDGFLDVLMYKGTRTLQGLQRIIPYTQGHYDRFPGNFSLKRGKSISIRSKEPLLIDLDGETFIDTNISVELIPLGVNIVAPNNLPYKKRARYNEV